MSTRYECSIHPSIPCRERTKRNGLSISLGQIPHSEVQKCGCGLHQTRLNEEMVKGKEENERESPPAARDANAGGVQTNGWDTVKDDRLRWGESRKERKGKDAHEDV